MLKNRPAAEIASELGLKTGAVLPTASRVLSQIRTVCREFDHDYDEMPPLSTPEKATTPGEESTALHEPDPSTVIHTRERKRPPLIRTGETVFGKYRLIDKIGEGGMGEVWLVDNIELNQQRALKLIRPEIAQNDRAWSRFQREARSMAKLAHPNAVEVLI